jgi:hypothetical protein
MSANVAKEIFWLTNTTVSLHKIVNSPIYQFCVEAYLFILPFFDKNNFILYTCFLVHSLHALIP